VPANTLNIVPYLRGHLSRDILGRLWQMIEEAGDWGKIFANDKTQDTPVSTVGDLVDWIHYIENPHQPTILLIGIADNEIVGFMWFKKFQRGQECGIWVKPSFRGLHSRTLVNKCLDFMFTKHDVPVIYGVTTHAVARNLAKKCGFVDEAKIDNMYYLTVTKEQFYA
jgi:RimJ/RimL family protein N-acetyltransferase